MHMHKPRPADQLCTAAAVAKSHLCLHRLCSKLAQLEAARGERGSIGVTAPQATHTLCGYACVWADVECACVCVCDCVCE